MLLADELSLPPQLTQRVADSEHENAQLTSSLDQKSHEVDTLLAVISLDLRTPLVNVQGFSEDLAETLSQCENLLEEQLPNPEVRATVANTLKTTLEPSLTYVRQGAMRLHHMLNAIQMVSRLDRSPLQTEKCPVQNVIAQVVTDLGSALQNCGASLEIKVQTFCLADRDLLAQVFTHLLDNAIRYRSPKRPLQIQIFEKVQPQPEFARWTIIGVCDNGIGFEPSRSDRLFALFHREHSDYKDESMGIGLYLARRAMWRMEGDIWAEGVPNLGATFWVALPPARS